MKNKAIMSILIMLMGTSILGQNFISTDKQWNVRLTGYPPTYSTEIYKIDGDSLVGSTDYNKIWASSDSLLTWQYQGLLREESNIVYYIPPDGDEGILYNFNLEIGDTAYVNNFLCNDIPIYIIDIDTVEYFGMSRKRWLLGEDGYIQESWVEGIGSLNGPLHTKFEYCIACPFWELLCYHKNDILEYIMSGQTDCYQNTVGIIEDYKENGFTIKPNPVREGNSIYIETNSVPKKICVFNSAGLLLKDLNSIVDTKISIKTNNFKSGLYFIIIITKENKMMTRKILIE